MIRSDFRSQNPRRRNIDSYKKRQFAVSQYDQENYPHRLSFYKTPPTAEIELEKFEQWAIDRLRSNPVFFSAMGILLLTLRSPRRD